MNTSNDYNNLPYNDKNVLINTIQMNEILNKHDVNNYVNDLSIYRKALLHKSYCTRKNENIIEGNKNCPENCLPLQDESNERLEFLGDAILNFVVADYLFERFPTVDEGFLTKIRTRLVNGNMLAYLSKKIGLGNYIVISQQIESNDGRNNKNILEDAFEAIIGAIYIDFNELKINTSGKLPLLDGSGIGFQMVKKWIIAVIETYIDFTELLNQKSNPKDTFVKLCQHNFQWIPKFFEVDVCEKNNKKIHTVCVKDNKGVVVATAKGSSRKNAEFETAKKALKYYGFE